MRRLHGGSALVVLLAFTASLLGAFVLVITSGRLVNDKLRLAHAADAAAYSAAAWEARSLNYQAYLNRAMVANEVAIAQLVSLRSWSRYIGTLTTNADQLTRYVPPLAAPMRALAQGWRAVDGALSGTLPPLEGAISRWNTDALQSAQSLAHQQALIAAADLVPQIVRANDPQAQISPSTRLLQARNAQAWQRFTQRYQRGGGDLQRYRRLLMDSRDGFSRSRRSDLPIVPPVLSLARRGGTDLIGEYSWRGIDTLSLHLDLLLKHVETPLGWGAAENRRQVVTRRGEHGGSLDKNPRASRLAQAQLRPAQQYRGLPEIRDLRDLRARQAPALVYSVVLNRPAAQILTPDRLLMPAGIARIDGSPQPVDPQLSAQALHAIASAEVYFQRPVERADGREEYPSLFNPYWQARLVATPATDRQLSAPDRGLGIDPLTVLP